MMTKNEKLSQLTFLTPRARILLALSNTDNLMVWVEQTTCLTPSTAHRTMHQLINEGIIENGETREDKRFKGLRLTPDGMSEYRRILSYFCKDE